MLLYYVTLLNHEHSSQALISFFFRQTKRKKVVKVSRRIKQFKSSLKSIREPGFEEIIVDSGGGNDDPTHIEQEMLNEDEQLPGSSADGDTKVLYTEIDEAKVAHDREVVTSVHARAIDEMKGLGVSMTPDEEKTALGLFPKVSYSLYTSIWLIPFLGCWTCMPFA